MEFYIYLFCITYFIRHNVFKFIRVAYIWIFFVAENIALFIYIIYTIFYLPIYLLMDTWVVSTFRLCWVLFPKYWHSSICMSSCLQFWGHCWLGVELLGFIIVSLYGTILPQKLHQQCTKILMSLPLCQYIFFSVFW